MKVMIQSEEIRCLFLGTSQDFMVEDPNLEEQREQRHRDRDSLNWSGIAHVAHEAGKKFVTGDFFEAEGICYTEVLTSELDRTEELIVLTFFQGTSGICSDVSNLDPPNFKGEHLVNGRHRSFGCWRAEPSLSLPIWSNTALSVLLNQADVEFLKVFPEAAARELAASRADILNDAPRCLEFLKQIASGNTTV